MRPGLALSISLVLSAPLVLAIASAGGAALFQARLDSDLESVALQVSGASPWSALRWALVPAFIASADVARAPGGRSPPRVWRTQRHRLGSRPRDIPELLSRLDRMPENRSLSYSGRSTGGGAVEDFRLVLSDQRGSLALLADRARFSLADERDVRLDLEDGWALRGVRPDNRVRFTSAKLWLDVGELLRGGSSEWSHASHPPPRRAAKRRAVRGGSRGAASRPNAQQVLLRAVVSARPGAFPADRGRAGPHGIGAAVTGCKATSSHLRGFPVRDDPEHLAGHDRQGTGDVRSYLRLRLARSGTGRPGGADQVALGLHGGEAVKRTQRHFMADVLRHTIAAMAIAVTAFAVHLSLRSADRLAKQHELGSILREAAGDMLQLLDRSWQIICMLGVCSAIARWSRSGQDRLLAASGVPMRSVVAPGFALSVALLLSGGIAGGPRHGRAGTGSNQLANGHGLGCRSERLLDELVVDRGVGLAGRGAKRPGRQRGPSFHPAALPRTGRKAQPPVFAWAEVVLLLTVSVLVLRALAPERGCAPLIAYSAPPVSWIAWLALRRTLAAMFGADPPSVLASELLALIAVGVSLAAALRLRSHWWADVRSAA